VSPTKRTLLRIAVGPDSPGFRRFWLATAVSVLGTWMAAVALSIRMYDVTGSPGWVSALLFAEFTPSVLIGFVAGHRLDRLRVRSALVACDVGSALAFVALALIDTPWAVVALAALVGISLGVFRPLSTAAVPMLVADDDLEAATGAVGSADNAMTFLGVLIGGVLVGGVGADLALALNALSFGVSGALIGTCTALARPGGALTARRPSWAPRGMARRIAASPVLRQIGLGWTIATFVLGVVLAVQVPLLIGTFDASPAVVGLLLGLDALGLVFGSLFGGSRRFGRVAYPASLAGIGACTVIVGAAPDLALAAAGFALLGIFNGIAIVLNRTRVVRETEPAERAQVISFLISLSVSGQALGTVVGGLVATAASPRWAFVSAGLGALVLAAPIAHSVGPPAEWELRPSPWLENDKQRR
jgi:MFS family permease